MKAAYNMKVNGRWVMAGEEYGEPEQKQMAMAVSVPETPAAEELPVQEEAPAAVQESRSLRKRNRKKAE